jgi:hypothetical protein
MENGEWKSWSAGLGVDVFFAQRAIDLMPAASAAGKG